MDFVFSAFFGKSVLDFFQKKLYNNLTLVFSAHEELF